MIVEGIIFLTIRKQHDTRGYLHICFIIVRFNCFDEHSHLFTNHRLLRRVHRDYLLMLNSFRGNSNTKVNHISFVGQVELTKMNPHYNQHYEFGSLKREMFAHRNDVMFQWLKRIHFRLKPELHRLKWEGRWFSIKVFLIIRRIDTEYLKCWRFLRWERLMGGKRLLSHTATRP